MYHPWFVVLIPTAPLWNLISIHLEEFVVAGDFLVYKFPVWAWSVFSFLARVVTDRVRFQIL